MKAKYILPLAVAALAVTNANALISTDSGPPLFEHRVSISLRTTFEGELTSKEGSNRFTESRRFVTQRLGNRQILEHFVEIDVIPEIRGYDIRRVTDSVAEIDGYYLVNKRTDDVIDVTSFLEIGEAGGVGIEETRSVFRERGDSITRDTDFTFLSPGSFWFTSGFGGATIQLQGLLESRLEETYVDEFDGVSFTQSYTSVIQGIRLDDGVGAGTGDLERVIVTGDVRVKRPRDLRFDIGL